MLIVDSQIHLWRNAAAPSHHRSEPYLAEQAITAMDAAGIAASINCPAIWDDDANDYADEVATAHPDRFATMGWFPLDRGADPAFVDEFLRRPGMAGLRFVVMRPEDCAAFQSGPLESIWSVAERLGKPIALMVPKPLLPVVGELAARHPGIRFLIDHLAVGPFEKLPAAMGHVDELLALARHRNVAMKASATPSMSNMVYPYQDTIDCLEPIFDAFGPDRMFWGTDITRMTISLRDCVEVFTRNIPWLKGADLERVMGSAVCDWIGWRPTSS